MNPQEARTMVDIFKAAYPDAYQLAKAVSIAVRVETELLRRMRLRLLPEIDAGAEADVWFSVLVQSQTPMVMTFIPEVVDVLREDLALNQTRLEAAASVIGEFHGTAPPALRLEEEVTWLALSTSDNTDLIRQRLESVTAAIIEEGRPGLVRWANRALPTLPVKARNSDAAHVLSLVAKVPNSVALAESSGTGAINDKLTQIITQALPRVKVGVRLLKKQSAERETEASEGSNQQTILVEFSYPPSTATSPDIIEVPQTNPVLIELSWQNESVHQVERVSIESEQTLRVEVGSSDLTLRTALGDLHRLQPRMDYDFFLYFNPIDRVWVEKLVERLGTETYEDRPLKVYMPYVSIDPDQTITQVLETPFRLSRKAGLVLSPESAEKDLDTILDFASKRLDTREFLSWIIPIHHRPAEIPPLLRSTTVIDFGVDADFEAGYRKLVQKITGERSQITEQVVRPETAKAKATAASPDIKTPARVFLSYSEKDKRYIDEFIPHLETLESQLLISTWHDSMIKPGTEWRAEIAKQLESADIILFFVSPASLASDFLSTEMATALGRSESGSALVIPIIVSPSNWMDTPLGNIQALPKDARPITTWEKRDEAYADIVSQLRRVLENRPAQKVSTNDEEFKPGAYRWPVRTAADDDVAKVGTTIVKTTIKALTDQPRPSDMPLKAVRIPNYQSRRASPVETTRWSVEANITAYKRQTSGGYRMTIGDADGNTMIAVAQDPKVLRSRSPLASQMSAVVRKLTGRFKFGPRFTKTEVQVRIVGLGFFNRWHPQSAGAPNMLELQPLLGIEFPLPDRPPTKVTTIETAFRGFTGSERTFNEGNIRDVFGDLDTELRLTQARVSRTRRGEIKVVARVEGPSNLRDFDKVARQTLDTAIARIGPPASFEGGFASQVSRTVSKSHNVKTRAKPRVARKSKKASRKAAAKKPTLKKR
jgi:TIR domain-containing protein